MGKNTTPTATDIMSGWIRLREAQAEVDATRHALYALENTYLDTLPVDECPAWCTAADSEDSWIRFAHLWRGSEPGVTACREHVGQLNTWIVSQHSIYDYRNGSVRLAMRPERVRRAPAALASA